MSDADPREFEGELLRHSTMLQSLARTLVSGPDADDLVQDTFVHAWQKGGRVRHLGAYLRRICHNLFVARQRSHLSAAARERRVREANDTISPSAHEVAEHRAAVHAVGQALAHLSDHEYQVVRLRFYDGLKPSAIAAQLALPVATVKRRLERALARMRAELGRELGEWRSAVVALCAWRPGENGLIPNPMSKSGGVSVLKIGLALSVAVGGVATAFWLTPDEPTMQTTLGRITPQTPVRRSDPGEQDHPTVERTDIEPPRSDAGPGERGSVRVTAVWSDGTPAAGAWAVLWYRFRHLGQLDAAGEVILRDVDPGAFHVEITPGTNVQANGEVHAGEETSVRLTIPPGLSVDGRVVDRGGQPVANAEIYLGGNFFEGVWITTSNHDGSFHIRDAYPSGQYVVAARADGFTPSPSYRLDGRRGETTSVTLELGGEGGRVQGSVVDGDDQPIAGATVALIPDQRWGTARGWGERPPPVQETRTADDGSFSFTGTSPGDNPLLVKARGFAPWSGSVAVAAGATVSVPVTLAVGSVVSGTVRDASGAPAAGAYVGIEWGPARHSFFFFDCAGILASADGSFTIDSLPAGELTVRARKDRMGRLEGTLTTRMGEELVRDLVLDAGLTLRGRVVNEQGAPLAGCDVTATFGGGDRTDADGRFVITNCVESTCTVRVCDWSQPESANPVALVPDVSITGDELLITVDSATRPSSFITGVIRDSDGRPAPAKVAISGGTLSMRTDVRVDAETGKFEMGPCHAGAYVVEIQRTPVGLFRKIPCHVSKGERHQLGELLLPATGSVQLVLQNRDAIPGTITIRLGQPPGSTWATIDYDESEWPDPLALLPGEYGIHVFGARLLEQSQKLTVTSGAETLVTFSLVPGLTQTLTVKLDPDDPAIEDADADVLDDNGQRVTSTHMSRAGFSNKVVLAPGHYTVSARAAPRKPPIRGHRYGGELSIDVRERDEDHEWVVRVALIE